MNVLIVYAHPEPKSLNGAIRDFAVERLRRAGHDVRVSDLYAMRWKASIDAEDFIGRDVDNRLHVEAASKHAFETGTQTADVAAEQRKLLEADALILQFPMWWFSMPAILKGWIDRVYAYGFAYGVGEHSDRKWGDRYGEGTFKGKRAMLIVTAGGWATHYSERGINGRMDDLLFPIHHGVLYYPGFDVLPPFVVYRTGKMDQVRYKDCVDELGTRLDELWTTPPIAYRPQNAGDYEIPSLELKPELGNGRNGFDLHLCPHTPEAMADQCSRPDRHSLRPCRSGPLWCPQGIEEVDERAG
jgi:NAD(P)H dehydrogenase (quinone)